MKFVSVQYNRLLPLKYACSLQHGDLNLLCGLLVCENGKVVVKPPGEAPRLSVSRRLALRSPQSQPRAGTNHLHARISTACT